MMFTTEMIQLFAVVLRKDSQRATEALLREGCMQFIRTSELESEESNSLSAVELKVSLNDISALRKRIEGFLYTCGIIPNTTKEADLNNRTPVDVVKENERLDKLTSERAVIRERQRIIQQEILKLEDIRRQIELYGTNFSDINLTAKHPLISLQIGKVPTSNAKQLGNALRDLLSLAIPIGNESDMEHYLLISMKRDEQEIQKILTNVGWLQIEFPNKLPSVGKNIFAELSAKTKSFNDEQKKLEAKANNLVKKEAAQLRQTWTNLRVNELFYKIQDSFTASARTVIFTGWLPLSKKKKLTSEITKASQNRCYLEWNKADSKDVFNDEVPVQLNNPKMFAPFQMLVSNFGIPKYGTVDPTLFVMPLYLAMFGLMFADACQGLVLVALGITGTVFFKKKIEKKGMYNLSWLIIWCGISSVLFGVLVGSYFGISLFKPLWFDFHGIVSGRNESSSIINNIYDILSITLYFGISVIFLGLLFNWINIIRSSQWMELFFDKGGIFGGWIYGGGVYIASYMVSHNYKTMPSGTILFLLVGLPSLLLFIKEPYHFFKYRNTHPDSRFGLVAILNFLMQWTVELLEIFSGYLSNTVSFMRVAGFGIAHVCLMIAFFTLAEMTSGIASAIILVLGNILVICLEGLSAGVQALRLSYYEFFTKFFHGTGKLYAPISLNSKYI